MAKEIAMMNTIAPAMITRQGFSTNFFVIHKGFEFFSMSSARSLFSLFWKSSSEEGGGEIDY